jgi:hypothetical protein
MDFPLTCSCGKENWIDIDSMQRWKFNSMVTVEGFTCQFCKEKVPFFYFTRSLEDALMNLSNPRHKSFVYHLQKALQKAIRIRENIHG